MHLVFDHDDESSSHFIRSHNNFTITKMQLSRLSSSLVLLATTMAPKQIAALSTVTPSNNAKIMAQNFEKFQLKKLGEAGLLDMKRPITIVAETIDAPEKAMRGGSDINDNSILATKIVHFQRHGQGYHNLLGEIFRDFYGNPVNLDDKDPETNPFIRPEILDSPLTEKGRQECANRRVDASLLNPQAVLVSPLHRAIQTAMLSFGDHITTEIPWIAHEGAREQMGLLLCNKRRDLSMTQAEFPHVDFTSIPHNEDLGWDEEARESPKAETERIYQFLTEFLMERPEEELALVGHSAWLFTMCNAVIECQDDSLKGLFATSEIRSMRISFRKTTEDNAS